MWIIFLLTRLCLVFIIQSWFVPDETWQVTEVAHHHDFGYGYLCWEWHEGIRSIFYPGFFSIIQQILFYCKSDYVFLMIYVPRLLSAIVFSIGDNYTYKICSKLYGKTSAYWFTVNAVTSWFLCYCAPRTLTSCAEMVVFALFLYHYPWSNERRSTSTKYLLIGGFGCLIRPTMAIFIFPYYLRHLSSCYNKRELVIHSIINLISISIVSVLIDSVYYKKLIFVPYNFLKFNLLYGLSSHYGTNSWHWYFFQGIPVTCGVHTIPLMLGLVTNFKKYSQIMVPSFISIFVLSFSSHKEFRFLLPLIPVFLIVAADAISNLLKSCHPVSKRYFRKNLWLIFLIVPNAIVVFYMGMVHQTGPLQTMTELRSLIPRYSSASILFLTPCHSTPLYSHLHVNIPIRFLTCEPNLNLELNYKDEADVFFEAPREWIRNNFNFSHPPSLIVMYDTLADQLQDFLLEEKYDLCKKIFNAHFYDGFRSKYFLIFCR